MKLVCSIMSLKKYFFFYIFYEENSQRVRKILFIAAMITFKHWPVKVCEYILYRKLKDNSYQIKHTFTLMNKSVDIIRPVLILFYVTS